MELQQQEDITGFGTVHISSDRGKVCLYKSSHGFRPYLSSAFSSLPLPLLCLDRHSLSPASCFCEFSAVSFANSFGTFFSNHCWHLATWGLYIHSTLLVMNGLHGKGLRVGSMYLTCPQVLPLRSPLPSYPPDSEIPAIISQTQMVTQPRVTSAPATITS